MNSRKDDPNSLVLAPSLREGSLTQSASLVPIETYNGKHTYLLYVKKEVTTVGAKELLKLFSKAGIEADAGSNEGASKYIVLLDFPTENKNIRDENYCLGIIKKIKEVIFR
jgi:hypothetical protein